MSRMNLSDRIAIEAGIYDHLTLEEIGKRIGKSPRYVSAEIRQNSTKVSGEHPLGKTCHNATGCKRVGLCGKEGCTRRCWTCEEVDCQTLCKAFCDQPCKLLMKTPYVCNVCPRRWKCKEELPVSIRTVYNYIDSGKLSVGNLDLRRKVGYRPRKKKKQENDAFMNIKFRKARTFEDFCKYIERHPETPYVEMDTVKGVREQGKRALTMVFVESNFMLIFLMRDGKAETVVEQFDWLTAVLGLETFRKLFPVILTDNGSEFMYTREMEFTEDGKRRTKIYYCDPQVSWQKPHVEKNHEFIHYVLPKGKSFNPYTQDDMVVLMNHIISTRRGKLDDETPFGLADSSEFQHLKAVMGLKLIPADEVNLTPRLLKRQ